MTEKKPGINPADLLNAEFWKEKLSSATGTGVAATVVMALMNLIGMLALHWVIVLAPAAIGIALDRHIAKKAKK